MKLYYSKGASSLSPHIALHEAGLPHTAVLTSIKTHLLEDGTDYHNINPLGYVPLLELDDGTKLSEGPAIVQYIADQVPEKKLAPANGTLARYQMQAWLTLIGTELHRGGFSPLFNSAIPAELKEMIKVGLISRLQWVDTQLANKAYLMGADFSVADGYLFTVTNWAKTVNVDLSGMSHLLAYRARVSARPAVQAAMRVEGLI